MGFALHVCGAPPEVAASPPGTLQSGQRGGREGKKQKTDGAPITISTLLSTFIFQPLFRHGKCSQDIMPDFCEFSHSGFVGATTAVIFIVIILFLSLRGQQALLVPCQVSILGGGDGLFSVLLDTLGEFLLREKLNTLT